MDRLAAFRLFVRIARKGSFSAASRELGIPQSTASRSITRLERDIGAALFMRTTRALSLTDVGSDFLARIEPALAEIDDAEQAPRGTGELRGVLRIALGTNFAVREVIPRLQAFMDRHPALQIDLMVDDRRQDLVSEGADVALRFGPLADSTATVRRVLTWPRVLVAAPAYLDRVPRPCSPSDLMGHAIILGPASLGGRWSFRRNDKNIPVRVDGRLIVGASEGAVSSAVAGLGIVMTPLGACRRELEDGTLIRLLPDWDAGSVDLNALFAGGKAAKRSARAIVDYLMTALRAEARTISTLTSQQPHTSADIRWPEGRQSGSRQEGEQSRHCGPPPPRNANRPT